MGVSVRKIIQRDLQELKSVLDSIELFPSEILEEMIADYFQNPDSPKLWFTAIEENDVLSIGYCAPEKLTIGTYNLLAIGVLKSKQGMGIGKAMMTYLEQELKSQNQRLLIVETSGLPEFVLTRRFYENLNYKKEAVLKDFWDEGDDKVIYSKKLA